MQTDTELQAMTVKELYALAQAHGIAGRSRMRKAELVDALEMSESYQQTLEPAEPEPTETKALAEDMTIPAGMFDPELTYYADGTRVAMCARDEEKSGTAAGVTTASHPYRFQVVRFDDGTTANVAPHVLSPEADAPELTRERAEELVLAAEAANDWHDATDAEILNEIVPANVAPDSIAASGSTRPDVMQAYRIVIGEADPTPADEGGELAGGPAHVYCRACSLESVASGVPYCEGCAPAPEYTVTVPKQYVNAPDEFEITIGISALGGGTVGESYSGTEWQWQVRENSTVVLISADLRSNATPATHADMARTLAAFLSADAETLAYGDRDSLDTEYTQAQRDFIESNGERLSAFAHNPFNH